MSQSMNKSKFPTKRRGAGRPRAIPEDREEEVVAMHESDLGYRAIARELEKHGIFADWTTVRRVIKKWQKEKRLHNGPCSNSTTILPLGN
jgi:23S rRNA G2069 N7-methylase RlmK/C1962 C5-methylase RlmI